MDNLDRYARQAVLAEIGVEGQRRLLASTAAVVGCGALGTNIANALVRAGVGRVRVIDRDFVELNNLQRQVLFDEEDIARALPKAIAAASPSSNSSARARDRFVSFNSTVPSHWASNARLMGPAPGKSVSGFNSDHTAGGISTGPTGIKADRADR